ncbi:olfactory receptor 5I1-like [Marmota flaviventris]|uniref:olfactory receptor 5I1-like n=1 Tax=Marmota flaviventris TaxID=93162 RepID=UPI003A8575E9
MCFFLRNLSFVDLCYSLVIVLSRKLEYIHDFLSVNKSISYYGCALKSYFFCTFADTEYFILAAMAYDRYVSICNPLLYTVVISRGICIRLIVLSYIGGNLSSLVHTSFAFILKHCDKNVINHFFYDLPPLLKLSCTDTSINEWLLSTYGSSVEIICFIIIITSYYFILLSVLKIHSAGGRKKTFSTCASHPTSVVVYQGTLLFIYSCPSSVYAPNTNKIISVFYTIIIPVLNPLTYSLRNKDVKDAEKKALQSKINSS